MIRYCCTFATFFASLSMGVVSAAGDGAAPLNKSNVRYLPYPEYGVEVGSGWNSFLEQKTPAHCVDIMEIPIPRTSYAIDYEFISDSYSYAQALSHSGGGKFKGFGFKASVSASGTSETKVNRDFLSALFTAEVNSGSTQAVGVQRPREVAEDNQDGRNEIERASMRLGAAIKLTPEARALLERNVGDFLRTCGDGFVVAVQRGVRAYVMATLQASSQYSKKTFAASVSAKGFGGAANFSTEQSQNTNIANSSVKFQVYQEGGLEPVAVLTTNDPKDFDFKSLLKPENLFSGQSSFEISVMPYSNIIDLISVDEDRAGKPILRELTFFEQLERKRALYYFLNDLEAILSEVDQDIVYRTPEEEWIYSPLFVQATEQYRSVAQTRHQVFRLLRIIGGSINECYQAQSPEDRQLQCDENTIQIPKEEAEGIAFEVAAFAKTVSEQAALYRKQLTGLQKKLQEALGPQIARSDINALLLSLGGDASTEEIITQIEELIVIDPSLLSNEAVAALPKSNGLISLSQIKGLVDSDVDVIDIPGLSQAEAVDTLRRINEEEIRIRAAISALDSEIEVALEGMQELFDVFQRTYQPLVNVKPASEIPKAANASTDDLVTDTSDAQPPTFQNQFAANVKTMMDKQQANSSNLPAFASGNLIELEALAKTISQSKPKSQIELSELVATIYRLAAATPLTEEQVDFKAFQKTDDWTGKSEDVREEALTVYIRDRIFSDRLYPLRESMCEATLSEAFCVSNNDLLVVAKDVRLSFDPSLLKNAPIIVPPKKTKPISYIPACIIPEGKRECN